LKPLVRRFCVGALVVSPHTPLCAGARLGRALHITPAGRPGSGQTRAATWG
jgi:hypothetical protein